MLICVALIPVLFVTLRAGAAGTPRHTFWCLACTEGGTLDAVLNIALFTPFGLMLAARHGDAARKLVAAIACSLALSMTIEISQLTWVIGRDPSLSDVIANTLGGALGAALAILPPRLHRAGRPAWLLFTLVWGTGAVAMIALGSWAMRFSVPAEAHYVQWEPQRPGYAPFEGRLMEFRLNDRALMAGEVLVPEQLPPAYLAGNLTMSAVVALRGESRRTALIARVAHRSGEFLMLGARGNALVARYRANAHTIGLRSPMFALRDALHPALVDSIRVTVRTGVVQLESQSAAGTRHARYRVTAARFWSAFLPFERPIGAWGAVGDGAWLTLLFGPVCLGLVRALRRPT
ncbi:MAG: VanZ family protein [Gemmatimonadota bacterium]